MNVLEIETTSSINTIKRICSHNEIIKELGFTYVLLTDSKYLVDLLNEINIEAYWLNDFFNNQSFEEMTKEIDPDYIIGQLFYQFKEFGNKNDLYKKANYYLSSLENALDEIKPDLLIQCQGAEIIRLTAHDLCKKKHIPSFFFGFSPFGFSFYDSPHADNWVSNKINNPSFSLEYSRKYLKSYRNGKVDFIKSKNKYPANYEIPTKLERYWKRVMVNIKSGTLADFLKNYFRIHSIVRLKKIRSFIRKFYYNKKKSFPSKYFFFPLHLPIESQVTLRGNRFIFQSTLITLISYMLPQNVYLLVREHPKHIGYLPRWELNIIKKLKNVVMFNTKIPAKKIILNSLGVITYNSTTGFEAILLGKPVITIGKSFYRGHGLTYDCDTLNDIYNNMKKISKNPNDFTIDDNLVLTFIAKIYESSYSNLKEFLNGKK